MDIKYRLGQKVFVLDNQWPTEYEKIITQAKITGIHITDDGLPFPCVRYDMLLAGGKTVHGMPEEGFHISLEDLVGTLKKNAVMFREDGNDSENGSVTMFAYAKQNADDGFVWLKSIEGSYYANTDITAPSDMPVKYARTAYRIITPYQPAPERCGCYVKFAEAVVSYGELLFCGGETITNRFLHNLEDGTRVALYYIPETEEVEEC